MKDFDNGFSEKEKFGEIKSYISQKIETMENGRLVTKFERQEVDFDNLNKGVDARDFSLSNLIATNATELLQPNGLINRSNLATADAVELSATDIANNIKNLKNE